MKQAITTQKVNCQDCHRCVRSCPVKAIGIEAGHASVVLDKCILCGECVVECPQHAKQVENQLDDVQRMLAAGALALGEVGDQQLLALVDELLSTGNIDVAKLARNALLQRFPDSPLTITVAQRLADAIKTAPAATPPPPPPLAVQSVTSQRVFLNNETAVVQAFAKVGFTIAQSPDNPRELRHDKNYFTVWIADCDTAPCKALQIRGQYLPTPMPSTRR